MSAPPSSARVVVIGAGIVGNGLVCHLARLGWTDIVQIDKGPLPNPGGSTGHASNFIFPVDHSREMTALTVDSIPLTPAVHQMIDIGPVPRFADARSMIEFPIVRDMDTGMYERQDGRGLEIGSYAHRPILHDPDEIPSIEESALSPTELPFTEDDFAVQMEHALELMPEIVGDESVGIKYAINGLLSLTPDGLPLLGETPEVKGLWSAAAVWVKEGPGVGRGVAEWMTHGESEIDLQSSDIARFYDCQKA